VAWVSLDEGDNDPTRFFTYVVVALQAADPDIGREAQGLLGAPQPPPPDTLLTALIPSLINDLAQVPQTLVLVLDDYHVIDDPRVHDALTFLLDHQPPHVHLVLSTREDPPLPLSRLRARNQMTEIRADDLRFTAEEAAAFLNRATGLALDTELVAALEARTEGWIAGLQLAALSVQQRNPESAARFVAAFSGRHHFVLDYLTDEVLRRQPEPVRTFLLRTSILERMCGALCDAVLRNQQIGKSANGQISKSAADEPVDLQIRRFADLRFPNLTGQQMLEYLHRANLFVVPLDEERRWYRYHRLFAELLRARLEETQPGQVPELHRRAATWYEENGLAPEAVHHALATGDFGWAAGVIQRVIQQVATWTRVDLAMLRAWLDALPDDVVRARPWLQLFASRALYLAGQRETAVGMLQMLEDTLQADPAAPDADKVLGLVAADRASYAAMRGEVRRAVEFARRALAHAPDNDPIAGMRAASILGLASFRAGDVAEASRAFSQAIAAAQAAGIPFTAVPLACNLAEVQMVQGQLRQARETCEQAGQWGRVDGAPTPAAGFVGLMLARILYEWNDLQAAERHVSEGLELLSREGMTGGFGIGHAVLARVRQAQGDGEGARAAVRRAIQIAQGHDIPRLVHLMFAYQARIWLAQGELDHAARWARDYRQVGETEYLREFEDLTLARALLAGDQADEALALLDALLAPAEDAGRMGRVVEVLALRALALQALGDGEKALDALVRALELAEPEGYVRTFVDEGGPMGALLGDVAARGIAPGYVRELLAAIGAGAQRGRIVEGSPPVPAGVPASPLIEPLTHRELEVLGLVAEGLTNPEIAQRLFISLPTVKSHTRNIYGKLGVHRRREAVAKARALGILPTL
jgi:LuxR family maltose regulon positive regulatory protein